VRLTAAGSKVKSFVSLSIFQEFISVLEGNAVKITDESVTGFQ
jgi:hypothetical protein